MMGEGGEGREEKGGKVPLTTEGKGVGDEVRGVLTLFGYIKSPCLLHPGMVSLFWWVGAGVQPPPKCQSLPLQLLYKILDSPMEQTHNPAATWHTQNNARVVNLIIWQDWEMCIKKWSQTFYLSLAFPLKHLHCCHCVSLLGKY